MDVQKFVGFAFKKLKDHFLCNGLKERQRLEVVRLVKVR